MTIEKIVYQNIEVTEANFSHALRHITADLGTYSDLWIEVSTRFDRGGYGRASKALARVSFQFRDELETEGRIMANVVGMRYADGVEHAVDMWLKGHRSMEYTKANSAMLKREQASKRIETLTDAFGHLPHHVPDMYNT